jgi:hypothetical protein
VFSKITLTQQQTSEQYDSNQGSYSKKEKTGLALKYNVKSKKERANDSGRSSKIDDSDARQRAEDDEFAELERISQKLSSGKSKNAKPIRLDSPEE